MWDHGMENVKNYYCFSESCVQGFEAHNCQGSVGSLSPDTSYQRQLHYTPLFISFLSFRKLISYICPHYYSWDAISEA